MRRRNGRSFPQRVQRLEMLSMEGCPRCRALEAMSPDARNREITELTAAFLGMPPDQIDAVIATLREMTPAEIQAWIAARNACATSPTRLPERE